MRLKELRVDRFKAFDSFTLSMGENAFLVGPNNAGKSTLVAAIRASAAMLRTASRLRARAHGHHQGLRVRPHPMESGQINLVTENLRHQFRFDETSMRLRLDTDLTMTAVWPEIEDDEEEVQPFFYLEHKDGRPITEPSIVRDLVGQIGIIPALTPLQLREQVRDDGYVVDQMSSTRTSQHGRNLIRLLHQAGEFEDFWSFASEWLPEIDRIQIDRRQGENLGDWELDLFAWERGDRTPKEMFWSGDGMQVFIQLLTHLWSHRDADVIVLDEPDLYLHADLQRRLVRLLESMPAQTITATHSPEMLAEASADSVIWIDKSRRRGVRRPRAGTMADLSAQIGSSFNLRLATALRAQSVVFVEGQDMAVLRRFASTLGLEKIRDEDRCTCIEMRGFTGWVHVESFKWFIDKFLEGAVEVFVLLDRDYRTDSNIQAIEAQLSAIGVHCHVWRRKELESYLLATPALARVSGLEERKLVKRLATITQRLESEVRSKFIAERQEELRGQGLAPNTAIDRSLAEFEAASATPAWRLERYPAKQVLSTLNTWLQHRGYKTASAARLGNAMRATEIPDEMVEWLRRIDQSVR